MTTQIYGTPKRIIDPTESLVDQFEPGVLLRALEMIAGEERRAKGLKVSANNCGYYLTVLGSVHDMSMMQVTNEVDPKRSYLTMSEPAMHGDKVFFMPWKCECPDHGCRKRPCKHMAWLCVKQRHLNRDEVEERATAIEIDDEQREGLGVTNEDNSDADNGRGDAVTALPERTGEPVDGDRIGSGRGRFSDQAGHAATIASGVSHGGTDGDRTDRPEPNRRSESVTHEQVGREHRGLKRQCRRNRWRTNSVAVSCEGGQVPRL